MAQRVVDRDARTHKGTRFLGRQCFGKRREGFRPCDHVFGVSAVEVEARDLAMHAHGEVPAPALVADETMATMPADTHTLPWPPGSHIIADGIDVSGDFMTWHTWILQPRPETFFDKHVAVANAARLDFHAHLPSARLRNNTLDQFPISARFTYLRRLHFCRHTCSYSLRLSHQHRGRGDRA